MIYYIHYITLNLKIFTVVMLHFEHAISDKKKAGTNETLFYITQNKNLLTDSISTHRTVY